VSKLAHLPASFEASRRGGVSEHLRLARGLRSGVSDTCQPMTTSQPRPSPRRRHYPSPPRPRPASDAAPPLACSRPPCDVTHVLVSAQPDRPGMAGVKSTRRRPSQAWGRAAGHYATYTDTICTIRACAAYETSLWATIPTIGIRSHRNSRLRGLGPLCQVKLQGRARHASHKTRYDRAHRYNTKGQKPLPQ
jgi:hypothetical protein